MLASLSYQQIRSIDFYQDMLARIQNVPTVDMRQGGSHQFN